MSARAFLDTEVSGKLGEDLSVPRAERLGRALGTFARRREVGVVPFLVGRRDDEGSAALREGVVRGLVLAGHDVIDLGICHDAAFAFALEHTEASSGVFIEHNAEQGTHSFELTLVGVPVVGHALRGLRAVYVEGVFAVGAGTLSALDIEPQWRKAGDWSPRFTSTVVDH